MSKYSSGVRFALYPTTAQAVLLRQWIGCQRVIYNAKVVEDKYFSTFRRKSLSLAGVAAPLDECYAQFKSELTSWLSDVPSQILRNGSIRWRGAKQRQLKGLAKAPVKRRAHGRQSVLITSELYKFVDDGRGGLNLMMGTPKFPVGALRFTAHRPYQLPKQLVISVEAGRWFVSFSFEAETTEELRSPEELAYEFNNLSDAELLDATVGYDRGVVNRMADSDGVFYPVEAVVAERVKRKEHQTRKYQRRMARQVKGSANRNKTKTKLAKLQSYRARCAQDWAHKTTYALVTSGTKVHVLEALKVQNMTRRAKPKLENGKWVKNGAAAKSGLNKSILASGWGRVSVFLKYKAARRNQLVLTVPAAYSSQTCSNPECNHTHADNRPDQAVFVCQRCGLSMHADINASRVIRARGVAQIRAGVVVKPVKRVAMKRKIKTGAGCPDVSVERHKTKEGPVPDLHAATKQKLDSFGALAL